MASNKRCLIELGMVPALAKELARQIDGGTKSVNKLAESSAVPRVAKEMVTQMNAGAGNAKRFVELSVPPRLAREIASQISGGTPTPTPAGPAMRTTQTFLCGSSTIAGVASSSTLNNGGVAVPPAVIGKTIFTEIYANTLPATAGENPAVAVISKAAAGQTTSQIATQLDSELPTISGKNAMAQFGGNAISEGDTGLTLHTATVNMVTAARAAGLGSFLATPAFLTSSNAGSGNIPDGPMYELQARNEKYFKTLGPQTGVSGMNDVAIRWFVSGQGAGYDTTANDQTKMFRKERPDTLSNNADVHDNSVGLMYHANQQFVPWITARSNGPVWLPDEHYISDSVTASAGKVCNLVNYFGTLAGCTFAVDDSRFTLVVNGTNLELWLTGASPKQASLPINITASKPGYYNTVSRVRVSVKQRTGTAPALVRFSGRCGMESPNFWSSTATHLSGFIACSFENYETTPGQPGYNPDQPAAPDSTQQFIIQPGAGGVGLQIYRNASGNGMTILCDDTAGTGTRAFLFNNQVAQNTTHGLRGRFFNVNLATNTLYLYGTSGYLTTTQAFYASQTGTGTTPGNGTMAINSAGENYVLFSNTVRNSSTNTRQQFFQGVKANIWIHAGTSILDFSNPATRALFFYEGTNAVTDPNRVVDLGSANGTVSGFTPQLYLPGDAAELLMGSTVPHDDVTYGHCTGKNNGSGGDFLPYLYGALTTL